MIALGKYRHVTVFDSPDASALLGDSKCRIDAERRIVIGIRS